MRRPTAAAARQLPSPREDFDLRVGHQRSLAAPPETATAAASPQSAQVFRLKQSRPGVRIRWSSLTGAPSRVSSHTEALSDPIAADPGGAARNFLKGNEDLFRLTTAEVDSLRETKRYLTGHSGVTHLTLQQHVGGIDLFQSAYTIHVDREGAVIAASGELIPGAARASNIAQPKITALDALRSAAGQAGAEIKEAPRQRLSANSADARQEFAAGQSFGRDVKARLVYFPLSADQARLAWEFVIWMRETPDVYLILIDAESNNLLYRHNLTDYEKNPAPPHGLVYTGDSPRPDSPHNSDAPPVIERQDLPFHSAPFNGSATFRRDDPHYDWWNGKPAAGLVSNNTDVHLDRDSLFDQPDLPRLTSPIGNFSFPVDLEAEPLAAANQKAAQVNLFYWINRYHDILYSFGFNEAAGNFQTDNLGLGGEDGDPVMGDVQDSSGINNANFATPPDGQPGRVQMYLWNLASPQLDGSFDQQVVLHELTHGLSNRLIGNGDGLNPFQSGGMGEGWSDFFSLSLLSEENDDPDAAYPVGGYVFNNYARGIRRYPYSTNMQVDPLTFGNLSDSPFFVHDAGEIWCTALWEMRALLIKQYGFREGQRLSLQLVVDGMKLTPSSPTFIDARDAILLADRVNNRGANQCLLWQAFAKRGLGIHADTLDAEAYEAVNSFETAPSCNPTAALRLDKRSYVDNETVRITLGDSNARTPVTVTVTSSRTGDQERIRLEPEPSLPGSYVGAIRLENGSARTEDGRLQGSDEADDQIDVAYLDGRTDQGGPQRITASAAWTRELVILDDDVERGNQFWLQNGTWAITNSLFGSPTHSWRVTSTSGDPINRDKLFMTSPPLDLTGLSEVTLRFSQNRQLRGGVSYGVVEISLDDGVTWLEAKALTDRDDGFTAMSLPLLALEGRANARLRFGLYDFFNGGAGTYSWAIDDIRLSGRSADPQIVPPGNPETPVIAAIDPAFGPPSGGTPVVIGGSNFTDTADTIVTFDGIPARQMTVLGSAAIIALVPPHRSGSVAVQVRNHRGTATLARGFTYYEDDGGNGRTPALGSVSPASGARRGGTVVTLTGANFTPETTVSFGSKEALVTFINGNRLRVVTPGAAVNGSVDVTARNGERQTTLAGAFNYVDATPPVAQLLDPQGGERLYMGGRITIRWQSSDDRQVVKHRVRFAYRFPSFPEFETFIDIAPDLSGDARSFTWMVPTNAPLTSLARIHVTAIDDEGAETDAVSGDFSIAQRWEAKALLPLLAEGQYTADGSNFYVIGQTRFGTPPEFSVQRYDPAADRWTSEGLTPPPVSFSYGEAVAVNGKLYIPGGLDYNLEPSRQHIAYDPAANTWTSLTDAPVYAFDYSLAADEQRGVYYHIGGFSSQDGSFFNSSAEVRMYDTNTGVWTDLPPMNHDHFYHSSVVIEGKLYVAGGYSDTASDPLAGEVYDFETRQWSPIAPLHTIRYTPANAVVKDAAGNPYWLFIGDSATQVALDAEAYDVRHNRWIRLDDSFTMPPALSRIDGQPLGRTLMGGGVIGSFLHVITNPDFGEFRNERLAINPFEIADGGAAPVLTAPKDQVGTANTEIRFNVSASDLDSFDPPAITAEGLPPGANFTTTAQNSDRTVGVFTWTPTAADTGRSFNIVFAASDGELSDTKQVNVRVVEASTLTLASAGGGRQIAVESIVTVAGRNLAAESKTAPATRLPIDLAGTRVTINGIAAPIFSVSPDRVSFLIPANIEPGAATIVVRNSSGGYSIGAAQIVKAAPVIFENSEGSEGNAVSLSGGTSLQFPRLKTPGGGRPNTLTIYGTGIRRLPGAAKSVNVTIDGQPARVLHAGAQGMVRGLDQVIVEIPASVRGSGKPRAEMAISINGVTVSRATGLIR
ncbi:MAG TPA: M36 family metallopeptidase [Blastocatellia bacterium]|nr:M36 family metallopeptidase [Blastocatellia bacterium]